MNEQNVNNKTRRVISFGVLIISIILVIIAYILWQRSIEPTANIGKINTGKEVTSGEELRQLKSEVNKLVANSQDIDQKVSQTNDAVKKLQQTVPTQSTAQPLTMQDRLISGPQGVPGVAGKQGTNGTEGLAGKQGVKGERGEPGADGDLGTTCLLQCVALQDTTNPLTVETGSISVSGSMLAQDSVQTARVQLSGSGSFPSDATAGMVIYRTDQKSLYIYDGSQWKKLGSSVVKIVAPAGSTYAEAASYVTDGTNDQEEIQAAIDSLGGPGVVLLANGTYITTAPIIARSDLTLTGMGTSTYLKAANASSINLIETPENEMVYQLTLQDFVLDGNEANTSGAGGNGVIGVLDHAEITRMRIINMRQTALRICPADKVPGGLLCYLNVITENEFTNIKQYGIWWDYPFTDSLIRDNNIGSTIANIRGQGGTSRIVNNHLDGAPQYNIIFPEGGQSHMIIGNIIEHSARGGVVYTMPPWEGGDVYQKIMIADNLIRGCGLDTDLTHSCVQIKGNSSTAPARGFTITGNSFESKDVERPRSFISIEDTDQVTISGNDFSSNSSAQITDIAQTGVNTRLRIIGNSGAESPVFAITNASGNEAALLDSDGYLKVGSAKFTGALTIGGSLRYNITRVNSTYVVQEEDHFVSVDTTSGAVTITLPDANEVDGRELIFKASVANSGLSLQTQGGQSIDGASSLSTSDPAASITVVSDGGMWRVL